MGGGGGGGNSGMWMMILMMQEMQRQREEQQRQIAAQQAAAEKQYATNSRNRYDTLMKTQNEKLGELYNQYNKNIDDTLAIEPDFNAGQKLNFADYDYEAPTGYDTAAYGDVDKWYGELDKKSYDDYNNFKKTLDQSNVWLNTAKQRQDILSRNMPGTPVGSWNGAGGGGNVSGEAGADSLNASAANGTGNLIGGPDSAPSVWKPTASVSGSGMIKDDASPSASSGLAKMFGSATNGGYNKPKSSAYNIF